MTEKVKQHAAPVTGSDEIDIGRLVGTVIEARWWVIGITAVFALCAVVYTFFATPIYSADALVQIEQSSGNSLVQDIGSALANKPPASDAEIQLIRSRLVLGKTVDDLDLDIAVSKNTFPIFGAGWDRLMGRQNETVKVTTFNRPKEMADQVFTLNVLDDKNYTLSSDGGFSARGQAGQMLKKEGVTLMVEAIHARPGSEFTVTNITKDDGFCWGSWILNDDKMKSSAIESAYLIYKFGFLHKNYKYSYFQVDKKNKEVIAFHKKTGATIIKEDDVNFHFEFYVENFIRLREKYSKYF